MRIGYSNHFISTNHKFIHETNKQNPLPNIDIHFNILMNRLYYAAYYVVNSLLMAHGIVTKTHSGTKSSFSQHFVKTGKFDKTYGRLLSGLFDSRQKGDYENIFAYDADSVLPLFEPVAEMITLIEIEIRASN